jgi:hypothetical protein
VTVATIALAVLLSGAQPARGAELVTIDHQTVAAWPSLVLRAGPDAGSAAVATIPFGEQVAVIDGEQARPETVQGGQPGRWQQVRWGVHQGWMFDGWLLPLPPPPSPCGSLDAWLQRWEPAGTALTEWLEDPAGRRWSQQVQHLQDGARLVISQREGALPKALWLPGLQPSQAWLVARRCHPALAPVAEAGWPPTSRGGLRVTRRAEELTIAGADGTPWLRLHAGDGGSWLEWR